MEEWPASGPELKLFEHLWEDGSSIGLFFVEMNRLLN